jgi:hypothetical protein
MLTFVKESGVMMRSISFLLTAFVLGWGQNIQQSAYELSYHIGFGLSFVQATPRDPKFSSSQAAGFGLSILDHNLEMCDMRYGITLNSSHVSYDTTDLELSSIDLMVMPTFRLSDLTTFNTGLQWSYVNKIRYAYTDLESKNIHPYVSGTIGFDHFLNKAKIWSFYGVYNLPFSPAYTQNSNYTDPKLQLKWASFLFGVRASIH